MNLYRELLCLNTVFLPGHDKAFARRIRPGQSLRRFGYLLFLLDDGKAKGSTERFIAQEAPRLVALLCRTTERQRKTLVGRIQGRPNWQETQKLQADPTAALRYACQVSGADFDRPVNQYLLYVLHAIQSSLDRVGPEAYELTCGGRLVAPRLRSIQSGMATLWRAMPPTGAISLPPRIEITHETSIRSARHAAYAVLAPVQRRYRELVLSPRPEDWANALRRSPLLPPDLVPPEVVS